MNEYNLSIIRLTAFFVKNEYGWWGDVLYKSLLVNNLRGSTIEEMNNDGFMYNSAMGC